MRSAPTESSWERHAAGSSVRTWGFWGNQTSMTVPLPGALSIRTHPPSASARSCIELSPRWPCGDLPSPCGAKPGPSSVMRAPKPLS